MNIRKISLGLLFLILALVIIPGALARASLHPPASDAVVATTCDPGCHAEPAATFCITCHKGFPTFVLSISATPTSVTAGTATPVTFTVRNGGSLGPLVSGALVSLSGAGLPSGTSGTSDSLGKVTISVNAGTSGSILATATKTASYTSGTTSLTASTPAPAANGTIAGRVTDASSASGISGVTVIAGSRSANTNATGYYSISIAPGTYNVAASASGYVNAALAGQVVTSNAIKTVNFALTPVPTQPVANGTIAGRVTNASSASGISGATVIAGGNSATTNATGYYSISIAPGTYNVAASASGYVNAAMAGQVVASNAIKTVNFALTPIPTQPAANGTIAGRVTNASSASGISGATVIAGGISATANATGYYSISIAPGTYNVAASASGYVNAAMAGQVVTSNAIKTVNFALTPATTPTSTGKFSLTFIVTDSVTGKPIHDAEVSMKGKEIETNNAGNAIFTNVAPGSFKYEIEMDGYREIEGRISVVGDTTIAIKLVKKSHRGTYNSRSHDED